MNPKKLIRDKIIEHLRPEDWEIVFDESELNNLYALKIQEELNEIKESNHTDIMEFADLIQVAISFANENGFTFKEVMKAVESKKELKGTFTKTALNSLNPQNKSNKMYFEIIKAEEKRNKKK